MPSLDAEVTPDVLAWARSTAGLSVDDAARRLDVRPRRLIEWEEGVDYPTLPQARKAAALYGRPLAVLFLPEPPAEVAPPPDFRRGTDIEAQGLPPELRSAIRLAERRRSLAFELDADPPHGIALLRTGTTTDVSDAAVDVRNALGVTWASQLEWRDPYRALAGWRQAVERLGALVFRFSGVDSRVVRGFSIAGNPYPAIALNAADSPAGRVFTLLHEVGHVLTGTGGVCDLEDGLRGGGEATVAAERFCNQLAASILMPRDEFLRLPQVREATRATHWTVADLGEVARSISVSRHAVLIRLLDLGRTNREAYGRTRGTLEAQPHRRATGFELPAEGALREVGVPFARLVLDAYNTERVTARDVADYLGVRWRHVARIRQLLA
jgi:Zn-dependent peptidase ImmA (M78 family)/DNA-binding XRE family transcriptional regulator